ncbi:galactoside 2-alpha-L-fucosyltransferase 2-like isoform X1 [Mizuhopecten yessoensis]|uniref:galactoside 2-alpha-L-fucosyltransferase 2-like isoform X1 n=1 Tax=Mizuhopecten yessoensis TaxID=6573 RepID=UPI000B45E738|nr:galactoside 2-alpha-L-fucosyltransferase 2-like isoform X1 [Mizuhopecten yessoensis]
MKNQIKRLFLGSLKKTLLATVLLLSVVIVINIITPSWSPTQTRTVAMQPMDVPKELLWKSDNNLLCPEKRRRLGNLMFEYASAYGIAREVDKTLVIPVDDTIRDVFKLTAHVIPERSNTCLTFEQRWPEFGAVYDNRIYDEVNDTKQNIVLISYFQSWKYFEKYKNYIKKEFTIKENIAAQAHAILQNISRGLHNHLTFIGIHVRRGDLLFNEVGYNIVTGDYLRKAIGLFESKYRDTIYIVCSDGMTWARVELSNVRNAKIEFVLTDKAEVDFAVLVACNHTIMTVGTFGWWAGYLAGGDVIYYKYPIKNNSGLAPEYDYTDFFPAYWIGLE